MGTDSSEESITRKYERIVLVDGVCHLCQGITRFIIQRDPTGKFHFASLQSDTGRELLAEGGLPQDAMDTFVLIDHGRYYTRSTGALKVAKQLRGPWPLVYALIIIPRTWRDKIYRWVARNRYRWFGKDEQCLLPSPEIRDRFL